jgi:hypothetical protein
VGSAHLSLRIKFFFLLWIIIRSTFDAAVSATAAWCILYAFPKVLWPQCFWAFLAIHFIWDLSLVKYVRTHTRQDCFLYLRLESISVVLSTFYGLVLSLLPAIAVIVFLSLMEVYTGLKTHWLHTWLLVACVIYVLSRGRGKRRMALRVNDFSQSQPGIRKDQNPPGPGDEWKFVVEQCPREDRVGSREYSGKATRSAPPGAKRSHVGRVIDV